MIDFQHVNLSQKQDYESILLSCPERGCEYSFANMYLWSIQNLTFLHGCAVRFSHFFGRSMYPYPLGFGDKRAVIEAIMEDAHQRGIPCRFTGITESDKAELERWFPGTFYIQPDRDSFDYVYEIDSLADLRGRKLQSKRNHFNQFCIQYPNHQVLPLTQEMIPQAKAFIHSWFVRRQETDPLGDYLLENIAITRCLNHWGDLDMEGLLLMNDGQILALTVGSRLSPNTFDVHFEKAAENIRGAYTAINCCFARYLRTKYPEITYLNREEDMGLEGLRTAKLSYRPHHFVEKYWACVREEIHAD